MSNFGGSPYSNSPRQVWTPPNQSPRFQQQFLPRYQVSPNRFVSSDYGRYSPQHNHPRQSYPNRSPLYPTHPPHMNVTHSHWPQNQPQLHLHGSPQSHSRPTHFQHCSSSPKPLRGNAQRKPFSPAHSRNSSYRSPHKAYDFISRSLEDPWFGLQPQKTPPGCLVSEPVAQRHTVLFAPRKFEAPKRSSDDFGQGDVRNPKEKVFDPL